MWRPTLVSLVFLYLNLAGCQSVVRSEQNGDARQHGDMINAVCSAMCPTNQTNWNDCFKDCKDTSENSLLDVDGVVESPSLICRSNTSLTVGWGSWGQQDPHTRHRKEVFLAELLVEDDLESNLTVVTFLVTQDEYVTFDNLEENAQYFVRVSAYNTSGMLGSSVLGEVLWTLPFNYTLGAPTNILLENLTYAKPNCFEAIVRWTPAEDLSCNYDVFVLTSSRGIYIQLEHFVPKDMYMATIFELKYETNYTVGIHAKSSKKESSSSWFSFVTPSCLKTHKNLQICPPPKPANGSVQESKKPDISNKTNLYDVIVKWTKPDLTPNYYVINVTTADNIKYHSTVNGTATEVQFNDTKVGSGYFVSITAVSSAGKSPPDYIHRSKHQIKTESWHPSEDNEGVGTLLWAILAPIVSLIIILTVALFMYHRHEKLKLYKRRCRYFEELEQKAPKEADMGSSFTIPPEDDAFEVVPEKIVLYEVLGEGAFGVVRKGWLPDQNREVAVKMLKEEPSAEEVKQFRQEIDMMKSVGAHAHIVSLVGCCTRPTSTMMLVVEFCAKGDLRNYLRCAWETMTSNGKPTVACDIQTNISTDDDNSNEQIKYAELLSSDNSDNGSIIISQHNLIVNRLYELQHETNKEEEKKGSDVTAVDLLSFGRQIAMGMEFLASNRVVHRDLAARNVLVCSDKTVKIADFGLSRDIYQENMYRKTGTGKLPIKWLALESLTHQIYTTQSDVWSFGVLLWEIVTLGANPYPSIPTSRLTKLLQSGLRMECPSNCSRELYNLMMACWQTRPKDRPSFSEIRQHLDSLLDGMCSQAYLSLDVLDYNDSIEHRISSSDQMAKFNDSNSEKATDSERYVRPISLIKTNKTTYIPAQQNHYIYQPASASLNGYPNNQLCPQQAVSLTPNIKTQNLLFPNNNITPNDCSYLVTYPMKNIENKITNGLAIASI